MSGPVRDIYLRRERIGIGGKDFGTFHRGSEN
jgi:hypothetical protein